MTTALINPTLSVQSVTLGNEELKLKTPFAMMIAGPSQSGKSEFMLNLVKFREDVCTTNFTRIIYCQANSYAHKNQVFFHKLQAEFPQAELIQGLPDINALHLNLNSLHTLILIDDMMREVAKSNEMVDLVTNDVHNFNISVAFTFQNYFVRGRHGNTLIRNCQYKVLFYNRSEMLELRSISTQTVDSPRFLKFNFHYLYSHYPQDPSHYILLDGHPRSQLGEMWCRSHIFPAFPGGEIKPLIFFVNPNFTN
jgi:hypothetical protein